MQLGLETSMTFKSFQTWDKVSVAEGSAKVMLAGGYTAALMHLTYVWQITDCMCGYVMFVFCFFPVHV